MWRQSDGGGQGADGHAAHHLQVSGRGLIPTVQNDIWAVTPAELRATKGMTTAWLCAGDFEVRVKVRANYENPDDQAGIMVREDAENWVKLGIQMVGDVPHMCSTITHNWSDFAMHPLPHLPEFMWYVNS